MTISYNCPHCNRHFQVDDSYAGQSGPCAACGQTVTVPAPSAGHSMSEQVERPKSSSGATTIIIVLVAVCGGFLLCGGILAALLLPAIQSAHTAARRAQSTNNMRQIGFALHSHHDSFNYLPLTSSRPITALPGSAAEGTATGYSFYVHLLPYLEEQMLYDDIVKKSKDFELYAFDPRITSNGMHVSEFSLYNLASPMYEQAYIDAAATEYSTANLPALSSYVALVDPFLNRSNKLSFSDKTFDGAGILVLPAAGSTPGNARQGISFSAIPDGTSQTVVIAESRETAYAAWYDGMSCWVVGAWPDSQTQPDTPETSSDAMVGWPDSSAGLTSLNIGPDNGAVYMSANRWSGAHPRSWGPSATYGGGAVPHLFGDAHVEAISEDIDPNVYLRLITRNGGEKTPR